MNRPDSDGPFPAYLLNLPKETDMDPRSHDLNYWKRLAQASAFAAITIALVVAGGAPFHSN